MRAGRVAIGDVAQSGGDIVEERRPAGVVEKDALHSGRDEVAGRLSAAAVIRLVNELLQGALEALHVEMQVEDLIDADRLPRRCGLHAGGRLNAPLNWYTGRILGSSAV